jgi:hypothetical protein
MINDLIALNKKALDHHNEQVIAMNKEMNRLIDLKNDTLERMKNLNDERGVMIHESKLLRETLNILENK